MTPQQMSQAGRFGDKVVAHTAPGELMIPPEMQQMNPQLMQQIAKAFQNAGLNAQQFTSGSPASSTNPTTGMPEYSIWGALLPVAGAIGGSFIPGIGTAAGAALGGAVGGAAGGAMDGDTTAGIGLSALGGAAGGYLGAPSGAAAGAAGAGVTEASNIGADQALNAAGNTGIISGAGSGAGFTAAPFGGSAAGGAGAAAGGAGSAGLGSGATSFGGPVSNDLATQGAGAAAGGGASSSNPFGSWQGAAKTGMYAGLGSSLGGMLAPPPNPSSPSAPSFGNGQMPSLNPNFNSLLGNSNASRPSFGGYNPYASATGNQNYNFYSPNQNGT